MSDEVLLRTESLGKSYGDRPVLRGLDLEVRRGQRVALLGANGAGKTTLFRCVLGTIGFEGTVSVDGVPVRDRGREARSRIGYVPQQAPAYDMTLTDFLRFFCDLRGMDPAAAAGRLSDLGLEVELEGEKLLRELSGGMLQKSVLALALTADAPLLLLDEPTASLDPGSRREFLRAVRGVDAGRTLLFASHRFEDIEALADRILVLRDGVLAFDGTPEELRSTARLDTTLWMRLPVGDLDRGVELLRTLDAVRHVHRNGVGLEAEVASEAVPRVLARLGNTDLEVEDLRTFPPSVDELVERILAGEGRDRPGGAA